MTVDRMAESLQRDGRGAPVVDLIAPPVNDEPEPQDALAALLHTIDTGELTETERAELVELDAWKRAKANHETAAKALGRDIEQRTTKFMELIAERQMYDAKGNPYLPDVSDGKGFELHPFFISQIWPKYREDPETDQPYQQEDLIEVLRAVGLDHLIVERTAQHAWPGYIREAVKAWRQRVGQSGVTNEAGEYVDAFGNVLTGEEAADPLADILALPPLLRSVIEPTVQHQLRFSRREEKSRAVAEVDAVEQAAEDREDGA